MHKGVSIEDRKSKEDSHAKVKVSDQDIDPIVRLTSFSVEIDVCVGGGGEGKVGNRHVVITCELCLTFTSLTRWISSFLNSQQSSKIST